MKCGDTTPASTLHHYPWLHYTRKCVMKLGIVYWTHNFCPVTRSSFHSVLHCKTKIKMLFNNVITDSTFYFKDYPVL